MTCSKRSRVRIESLGLCGVSAFRSHYLPTELLGYIGEIHFNQNRKIYIGQFHEHTKETCGLRFND